MRYERLVQGMLAVAAVGMIQARAGNFSADFNDGATPAGSAIYGSTIIDNGILKLTTAVNGVTGGFVVDDLDSGEQVNGFTADFKMRVGGGTATPADGFSFCFASDLPAAGWSEEGAGTGLIVAFDIYDNGGGEAPAVDIKWNNTVVRSLIVPISTIRTGSDFVPVRIKLDPDGSLDVIYNGNTLHSDFVIPGFAPIAGAKYGFGARTGGLNENQWVDDLQITTTTGALAVRFNSQPRNLNALLGSSVTLRATVNDPAGVSGYQWQRKGSADANFTDIAGANEVNYTTPALTAGDNGTQYRLLVTPVVGDVATSTASTVNVIAINLPSPGDREITFDDGTVPADASILGSAAVDATGGSGGSPGLVLTPAENGQGGALLIPAPRGSSAVDSMTASFKLKIGPGSEVPADGFSFNWASNLPDAVFGEDGAGTGLTVAFDIYDNGGGEGPSIDLKWNGTVVASQKLSIAELTLSDYVQAIVRVESDGTADVVYNGEVVHSNVALPGFTALANGRFGFGARTGGLNALQAIDDISITTTLFTGPVVFTTQPAGLTILPGSTTTLTAEVNDPARSTYQWQRKGPSDAAFANIAGATSPSFTTPALSVADSGTAYRVIATGPQNSATSSEAVVTVLNLTRPASPDVNFTFDDSATPAGTIISGNATIAADGGIDNSGVLHLTDAINSQVGTFVINDFKSAQGIDSFTAAFQMRVGGGSEPPADGFSFNWATDLADAPTGDLEEGVGSGLRVTFDIYDNGGGEAPSIDLKWKGATLASTKFPLSFLRTDVEGTPGYKEVLIQVTPDGKASVAYGGVVIYQNVTLPGFSPLSGARFALVARTGGLNENQWVDNLAIKANVYAGPIGITTQPASKIVTPGKTAQFTVGVNDPARATIQWQRKGPSDADFANIPGATEATLLTDALTIADNGAQYRVIVSAPGNSVTSDVATVTVLDIQLPANHTDFTFDEGVAPEGTAVYGSATVEPTGGVDDTGRLVVTSNVNSQTGSFIVNDLNAGAPADGFVAIFQALIGGGTQPPADGFSFVWSNELGSGPFGEDGAGGNLVISFDSYDNGGGEAPAVDVFYKGNQVGSSLKVPLSFYETQGAFVPVIVRVEPDGTLDVAFNGEVLFYNLPLPGFTPVTNGRFGIGARTGGLNANHIFDNVQIGFLAAGPNLSIALNGGGLPVITFDGTLEAADNPEGPYTPVNGATSPFTVPNLGAKKFYRAVSAP